MVEQIKRLTADDFEEAMDFLNMVFSLDGAATDFPVILPKLYRPTEQNMNCNLAIRKNGRIRAIVGLFPMTAHIGGKILKVGGIGGVSTHPNDRKTGLMRQLMEACIEEIHANGIHFSCLGGLRQRYQYYGYEKAGTAFKLNVTKKKIQHCLKDMTKSEICFKRIEANDHDELSHAKKLYDSGLFHCDRPLDEFYSYLKTWSRHPWAAMDPSGRMIGYIVTDEAKKQIDEILADNPDDFFRILCAWIVDQSGESVSVFLPPWERTYINKLGQISENVTIQESYNWRIFNWVEVIGALFAVKSGFSGLADGEAKIGIRNYGVIRICVKDGFATVEKVDNNPDLLCDEFTALRLFCGPMSPEYITELPNRLLKVFSSWFPLPLCWYPQDGI
jgi:predicted acetyltransferase